MISCIHTSNICVWRRILKLSLAIVALPTYADFVLDGVGHVFSDRRCGVG